MAFKGRSTQWIVNSYPPWSAIRKDEQSLGYQFLNSSGLALDDMRSQLERVRNNYYLPTAVISDVDTFYSFQLPSTYTFTKSTSDSSDMPYTPPTVSGLRDGAYRLITAAAENDIETFWYDTVPSTLSIEDNTNRDHVLVNSTVDHSPYNPATISGWCHIPNSLTVKLDGGDTYLYIEDENLLRKGLVQIHGITRAGQEVNEELIFLNDETQSTLYEYQWIYPSGIKVYGVEPETTRIRVTSANFNASDYPISYSLDVDIDDHDMPLFWAIGSGTGDHSKKTLDLKRYTASEIELRLEGYVDKEVWLQQELLDVGGSNIIPVDLAVEPHSNRIWVADSSKLYVYDSRLPYPDTTALTQKDYDAASVIEPSSYYVIIGDEVSIDYIWARPTTGLICHRAWVVKPDGTMRSLVNGSEVAYAVSWVFGEPNSRLIRPTETYTLNQRGDYIYNLEVRYTDETSSIDQRIVTVASQTALAEYNLTSLGLSNIVGVDFDSEYKLWVLDNTGTKTQLKRRYDYMLLDFDKKILYFREPYQLVRIY